MQYRAGDILLPASGTFVADSGRSIFLEQSFEQRGSQRNFRWEIPYQYIVRLEEKTQPEQATARAPSGPVAAASPEPSLSSADSQVPSSSSAATSTGGAPAILPLQNRPKTA